jgi:hypothetical protein
VLAPVLTMSGLPVAMTASSRGRLMMSGLAVLKASQGSRMAASTSDAEKTVTMACMPSRVRRVRPRAAIASTDSSSRRSISSGSRSPAPADTRRALASAPQEPRGLEELELDGVAAGVGGDARQFERLGGVAVVVDAQFGDA